MRQLVCLQIHNDYQIPGGETKTAELIANLLENKGIKVIRYYKSNRQYVNSGKIDRVRAGLLSLYNPQTVKDISNILEQTHVDFALVHNVVSVISNSAYKILIKKGVPIVKYLQNYNLVCLNGTLNGDENCKRCLNNGIVGVCNRCYKNSYLYSFIKFLIKKDMDKNILPYIAAFMPNSYFVMNEHVIRGINANKMYIMHNFMNIPQILLNQNEYQKYVYFGRLSCEKGIFTLLKAFSKTKECQLIIMGSGPLENDIKNFINENNLVNILYIGSKNGDELLKIVASAKAVIVPSEWNEPFPRTILESYSQGTPVIGSNRGGVPEMIKNGVTGYIFEANNVDSLCAMILKMENLKDEDYLSLRANCLKTIECKYSEDAYYSRFINCVKEII